MIILRIKNKNKKKPEIDLNAPEGNAFALLGYAKAYAKQLNKNVDDILERMQSSDYENLIKVFDEEFGEYVDLII